MARTPKSVALALLVWVVILAGVAAVVRTMVLPRYREKRQRDLTALTGARPRPVTTLRLAADGFSGYCLLRSSELAGRLEARGIALTVVDDGAEYMARLEALRNGRVEMAAFPVNSLVQCGARLGEFPATIVYVLDETVGADALVAWKDAVARIGDLNRPDAVMVLTPDSPSEFLARVVLASFELPNLNRPDWYRGVSGSSEVYKAFRGDSRRGPCAYAMWEPEVSRALADPGAHVLLDSSRLRGYIVDVLVAGRQALVDRYDAVKAVVEEYARSAYAARERMPEMVREDSRGSPAEITRAEAEAIVKGILWKTTLENYRHLAVETGDPGADPLPAILRRVTEVLVKTGAIAADPLAGRYETLYFDRILREMKAEGFHPSRAVNVLSGTLPEVPEEEIRGVVGAAPLTEAQWDGLVTVGEMRVEPILFGRGTARIGIEGRRSVAGLAAVLRSWPHYYLVVTGRVRPGGDEEEALRLARDRAETVVEMLAAEGIPRHRVRTAAEVARTDVPEAQCVAFVVRQAPY